MCVVCGSLVCVCVYVRWCVGGVGVNGDVCMKVDVLCLVLAYTIQCIILGATTIIHVRTYRALLCICTLTPYLLKTPSISCDLSSSTL